MILTKSYILWLVFFSALATGVMLYVTHVSSIVIGLVIGSVSTTICYFALRKYVRVDTKEDEAKKR